MYMKKTALLLTLALLLCALFLFGASAADCQNGQHDFGPWEDVVSSPCDVPATQKRTCKTCGKEETQTRNALAHDYSTEYTVDKAPTCTEAGEKSFHCKRCGKVQPSSVTAIPAKGHSFGDWKETKAPTCTEPGAEKRTCANCKEEETRTVSELGHERVTLPAKEPTCTENGRGEGVYCKRCNQPFQEAAVISALGHDIIDDPAKEPTCTEDGCTAGRHCRRCGYVETRQQTLPKLGHKTVIDPASPSTCTEHGKTQGSHCSVCGKVFYPQEELALLPHDYEETVVTKTCISDGYHQFTCRRCGQFYRDNIDYAYGHQVVIEKAIDETCTTDGLSIRTYCSVCGEVLEEAHVIPARGHRWQTKVTKATRKQDGKLATVCADCGERKSETVIPKIDTIKLSKTKYYCDGKKKTPSVIITDAKGSKLVYKKDFKTAWDSGRKTPGTYYVTISFIGNYEGSKTLRFKILLHKVPNVKATAGKNSAKVTWSKVPGAKSYVVYICETKNGTYKKAGVTGKTALNIKKLESGRTYYFIVRARAADPAGKTILSQNSAIRKVKVQ